MVEFVDIEPVSSSIIMVVGVGGGGSNAVNHMFKLGITDVSFMVCNTDRQALQRSPIPTKIRLGETLTEGLGAGNKPERGRAAAEESIEEIKELFRDKNIKMIFVTAGMGGGTGTGAAPVIAKAAKELGILTVAIVTIPFKTEGRRRIMQAIEGIEEIWHNVDSLLVVNNENIHEIYGDLTLSEAFGKADDILATAAKTIAEIITHEYRVNVDFADVQTVMKDSGIALMGSARGGGENRALEVAEAAMSSPLLNHKDISGAKNVLLNITSGNKEVTLTETYQITEFVQNRTGNDNTTDLIWGAGIDESLGDDICITVIATGFDIDSIPAVRDRYAEVVGHGDSKSKTGAGQQAVADVPKRETISLIDMDHNTDQSKKPKVLSDSDADFNVVTHGQSATVINPYQEAIYVAPVPAQNVPVPTWTIPEPRMVTVDVPSIIVPHQIQELQEQVINVDQLPLQNGSGVTVSDVVTSVLDQDELVDVASKESEYSAQPVTSLTEDELDNIPAYIRRRMNIKAGELPVGSKVSRETLKGDSLGAPKVVGHLFD